VSEAHTALLVRVAATIVALHPERIVRIAIDGVDGAGKTTLADALAPVVAAQGRPTIRASVDDFHALVIPGGTVNADKLRSDRAAVAFVHDFVESGKPVGVICHGPWTLVEAGVVNGRTLTSYPSVRTDLRNAGANAVDEEVAIDGNLISSRTPDDLPAFCAAIVDRFASA